MLKYYEVPSKYKLNMNKNIENFLKVNKKYDKDYILEYLMFSEKGELLGLSPNVNCLYIINNGDQLIVGKNTIEYIYSLKTTGLAQIFYSQELFNQALLLSETILK